MVTTPLVAYLVMVTMVTITVGDDGDVGVDVGDDRVGGDDGDSL